MKFTLEITCDNAAFDEIPEAEIARILRELANDVADGSKDVFPIHDLNGNRVGFAYLER